MRYLIICFLLSGAAGCGPKTENIPMIDGRIDNFEDGDVYNNLGFTWENVSGEPETNATIFVESGGVSRSRYQMTVGGMRPIGSAGDKVSGARVRLGQFLDDHTSEVTDATAYDGLEIRMKGTPGSFIVQIGTLAVTDFDYYNSYIEVSTEWNLFRIPFALFKQEGFGRSRKWSGDDLTHIAIYSNIFGPYTIAVDDIGFYSESEIDTP